jgi:hypothetical protein
MDSTRGGEALRPGRRVGRVVALVLAGWAIPFFSFAGPLDAVTRQSIAAAGGILLDQVEDGADAERAEQRLGGPGRGSKYKPVLIYNVDTPRQLERVECGEQKLFLVNADEPGVSGTRSEFEVLRITVAVCDAGPFSHPQVTNTAENTRAMLTRFKDMMPDTPQIQGLRRWNESSLGGGLDVLAFSVVLLGHGFATVPTAVAHGPASKSLVVQAFFDPNFHLPKDAKGDTPVTAPLRRALADPLAFAEAILRGVHTALPPGVLASAPAR